MSHKGIRAKVTLEPSSVGIWFCRVITDETAHLSQKENKQIKSELSKSHPHKNALNQETEVVRWLPVFRLFVSLRTKSRSEKRRVLSSQKEPGAAGVSTDMVIKLLSPKPAPLLSQMLTLPGFDLTDKWVLFLLSCMRRGHGTSIT